ncbi:MAG: zinc-binding dehydrogenase [Flavobacteriales bacterium]
MKAIVLVKDGKASEAFDLREVETPKPGKNDVLVKVTHFGLNYADVMSRNGLYNDRPELPCILGYEVVGTAIECGSEVKNIQVGDTVLAFTKFGAYAEFCSVDCRGVVPLAPGTDPVVATALATQYCTAWFAACHMTNLHKGDRVLIHAAAGGVGTALVQIARWKGCEVFGTAGQPEKLEYLKSIGVDHPINYRQVEFDQEARNILKDNRIDVAFDPIGGKNFRKTLNLLGSGGRIVSFGASEWSASKGGLMDKLKLVFGFGFLHPIGLLMKSRGVIGLNMLRIAENKPAYMQQCMVDVMEHYKSGVLKPYIDSVFKASDIAKAHDRLESRQSIGKVVVEW